MATNKFSFSIEVEGQETPPKKQDFDLKFPRSLKKMGEMEMEDWVRARTQAGFGIDGKPFLPKANGAPTNLVKTGAMLNAITAAKMPALRDPDSIAALGITCDLGSDVHYPWILNSGVDPDVHRGKLTEKVLRKIRRKEDRLDRKRKKLAETDELLAKWDDIMETIMGIEDDLQQLHKEYLEALNKKVVGLPARPWWGLIEPEREKVYAALKGWLATLVDGVVANACNPVENKLETADENAQEAFKKALKGEE